ncbi:hypothetical protein K492DRAFT_175304 [Lichtheimia hyalospora FSU 10163]|nr:hypothetical protein K492DRAFT_175304 [Lichtheimia hyalospora FSU 10163]
MDSTTITAALMTPSQVTTTYVAQCLRSNPAQFVKLDILGHTVELPVFAMRRRNALAHL